MSKKNSDEHKKNSDEQLRTDKLARVLKLYTRLMGGATINKAEEAERYGVHERSIQRDMQEIRRILEDDVEQGGLVKRLVYDPAAKGYHLEQIYLHKLTNSEILAVCKILLDSRAFVKKDMKKILDKLVASCVPRSNQKLIADLIKSELFHYIQPRHGKHFLDMLWELGQAVRGSRYIVIGYERTKDKKTVERKLKPAAIMFSEYYFYLAAFIDDEEVKKDFEVPDDIFPTIYRVDRIRKLTVLDEKFHVPYNDRFNEGEFRKRIQFMYGGKLQTIKFRYVGTNVEAILDRLPTAQILSEEDGEYIISAEVFGKGINMWLQGQGSNEEIIK